MMGDARNHKIEFINTTLPSSRIRCALFDFDGTLSLLREGWQEVMIAMMVKLLLDTPKAESVTEIRLKVEEFVHALTGKQTIYQMQQLVDEIELRGGSPKMDLFYKREYYALLQPIVDERMRALEEGSVSVDQMLVPGSLQVLAAFRERSIVCYMASGTDREYVIREAKALGLYQFFQSVFGALDDPSQSNKRLVIGQILQTRQIEGGELVTFGDGFVEIEETKRVGGVAIGVASNESQRSGIDKDKRKRLIDAGADAIIPDFSQLSDLIPFLFHRH